MYDDGMRAAVYVRISRDTEGDALGVARQERDCQELAKRLGWEVVSVFNDNDLSAFSGKRRPGYDALLEGVRTGDFGAIVAWHPDRLHRSPRELEGFIDLIESTRVRIATVQTGEYDLTTTAGRMIARVVGAMARGESEHKSDRLRRKHRELAEAGKLSGGGTRPFGFESDRLTILESEAALIREAADRFLAGESVRSIAVDWNTRGVLSVTSRQWSIVTLSTVLRSARIAGLRDHGSTGIVVAEWPAIITPEQHHRLVAIFNSPSPQGRTQAPQLPAVRSRPMLALRRQADRPPSHEGPDLRVRQGSWVQRMRWPHGRR
jgi:site-specific DNA recombinase